MRRLISVFRWDMMLQYRYKFYAVSVAVVLFWGGLLSLIPEIGRANADVVVPAFFMINLNVTTFYFVGGLVLLEKGEGILTTLVTTPLRDTEYLLSKVMSLTLLAIVESAVIVVVVLGTDMQWGPLLLGAFLLGTLYTLIGLIVIVQYDSINAFLMPSVLYVTALMLPLLPHFALAESPLFYLHPVEPAMVLMRAAYMEMDGWQMVYGIGGGFGWVAASFVVARQRFYRFVIREAGA